MSLRAALFQRAPHVTASLGKLRRRMLVAAVLLAQSCMMGCGSQGPFEYVPVKGKVVYEDGSPVTGGELQFVAQDVPPQGTMNPRPAMARLKPDGTFDAVTSYKYGDGLIPGKHKVAILNAMGSDGKPLVPEEFASAATTPLEIDTAESPLVITVPKP